ncbi:DinI family protein [Salmonella enterica subsp. diarizonae serovar 16:z10:e,n,x,z15]|nr:DinI family protein [Salmonella enterica subsp. diarizonae]MCH5482533.1 DinI family protein [Salmonella enterica subsp. diarizonae serovar 16:z10:e,n,x,z15]
MTKSADTLTIFATLRLLPLGEILTYRLLKVKGSPYLAALLTATSFLLTLAASKHEKEQISRTVQEMFEEADMWLVES